VRFQFGGLAELRALLTPLAASLSRFHARHHIVKLFWCSLTANDVAIPGSQAASQQQSAKYDSAKSNEHGIYHTCPHQLRLMFSRIVQHGRRSAVKLDLNAAQRNASSQSPA
jgi:hypothetical protein